MLPEALSEQSAMVADDIRREFALGDNVDRFVTGTQPVFAAGDSYVIKLFQLTERRHFETEVAALTRIDSTLSIPTPRVVATGQRGEWWFVAMTRLLGRPLVEVWQTLAFDERCRLVSEVGASLAELHALATDDLAPLAVDWSRFMRQQRDSARDRQAAKGLEPLWLDQVDAFLERWHPADDGRRVLLHTEVMREHLLVDQRHGTWQLSGLFDFEPAMVGAPEYEFASVGIFVACAEPKLFHIALDAYGLRRDDAFPLRVMAYSLLHRYSNLRWYLERLPHARHSDLESLARSWFAT